MRTAILAVLLASAAVGAAPVTAQAAATAVTPATTQLAALLKEHWAWYLANNPVQASMLGVRSGDGKLGDPSLAAADVSVAMGARGSDAALEQAEVILMHDRIENFLAALRLSRRAKVVIRQNLGLSLGVVVVMVVATAIGAVPLAVGVAAHEGSTLVVCLNSLRLLLGRNR